MIEQMFEIILELFSQMGYIGIIVLMMISFSMIPFSSQVVVPPAAILASKGELNLLLVILAATLGSLLGALSNYFLASFFGRTLIYKIVNTKIARICRLSPEKVKKAEEYYLKHGIKSTFIGYLIPGIRQLISLPAGLAKMNLTLFIGLTSLAAFIWATYLALLGYYFGENIDIIFRYIKEITIIGFFVFLVIVIFFVVKKKYLTNFFKK